MAYGFQIFGSDSVLRLSSDSLPAAVKDTISITAGVAGTRGYPDIVGYTLFFAQVRASIRLDFFTSAWGDTVNHVSVSYPGGVPTINWDNFGQVNSQIFVFVK